MPRTPRLAPADIVSLSRVLLAGAFILTGSVAARLIIVAVAGLTDWLDGWLARRGHAGRYGAVIDPATDRVFVVAVVVTLVAQHIMTVGQCLLLMARDIATTIGVVVVRLAPSLRPERLQARWSGKVVTALQFITLIAVLLDRATLDWLLPVVAVASVISIADYSAAIWRARSVA